MNAARCPKITVYSDGSYCPKTGAAGWGAVISLPVEGAKPPMINLELTGPLVGASDNNDAELTALNKAVGYLLDSGSISGHHVILYTDSENAKRNFDAGALTAAGVHKVSLRHSPGHKGARSAVAALNSTAHHLALSAMKKMRDNTH